jgi:hypothetical protein
MTEGTESDGKAIEETQFNLAIRQLTAAIRFFFVTKTL